MEDEFKKNENGRQPKKTKKKLVSIPPKFRGKPFLGLAQLSKISTIKSCYCLCVFVCIGHSKIGHTLLFKTYIFFKQLRYFYAWKYILQIHQVCLCFYIYIFTIL